MKRLLLWVSCLLGFSPVLALAEPGLAALKIEPGADGSETYTVTIQVLMFMTALSLLPAALMMISMVMERSTRPTVIRSTGSSVLIPTVTIVTIVPAVRTTLLLMASTQTRTASATMVIPMMTTMVWPTPMTSPPSIQTGAVTSTTTAATIVRWAPTI